MKIILLNPNEKARIETIDETIGMDIFEVIQNVVGDYVEMFRLAKDYYIVCDEEGKLKQQPYNFTLFTLGSFTHFVGNIVIVKLNGEDFDSVDEDFAKWFVKYFDEERKIIIKDLLEYFDEWGD